MKSRRPRLAKSPITDRAKFAEHVRQLRERHLWTQETLATKAGLAVRTVQRVEHGTHTCYFETAAAIAKAFGVRLESLL